jgi:hypothetical protein
LEELRRRKNTFEQNALRWIKPIGNSIMM